MASSPLIKTSVKLRGLWRTAPLAILGCLSLATTAAASPDGRQLYLNNCAPCHGREGRGDGPDAEAFSEKPRNLREGFLDKYSTDELVRRIREGKQLQLAVDLPALKRRVGDVNALTTHLRRLPSVDWELTREGWLIYTERCESCHGRYGTPPKNLPVGVQQPRDLSDPAFQRSVTGAKLIDAVRHGRDGMPALAPRVPEDAGRPLAAFVQLLSPGFALYTRHCAACHGDDGLGEGVPVIGTESPVKFDRAYFARTDGEDLANAVWHMVEDQKPAMLHYRWTIDENDARAIVEYLKQPSSSGGNPEGIVGGDDSRKADR